MIEHYLSAVEYAGATLEWNDAGVVLHTVETLDRSKLEPWLLRWAGNDLPPDATLSRVPATAIALASGHVDAAALYEALCLIVPDLDQAKLRNLETMLGGVLLGQDLRTRILPQLGPGLVAYVEPAPDVPDAERGAVVPTPPASRPFAQVLALSLRNSGGGVTTAAAIENALRTLLAFAALDGKRNEGRSQITVQAVAGTHVTSLSPPVPFAYAIDASGSRLILGTSASAVARYLQAASNPQSGDRFRQFRARAFPDASTFLCVDLSALCNLTGRRRDRVLEILAARQNQPDAAVERDGSQVLEFARLFEAAFITSRFEPGAAAVHRRAGLLMPEPKTSDRAQDGK